MSKGVVVFDLDLTLGDFRAIDYFGLIYEPISIAGRDAKTQEARDIMVKTWNNYYSDKYHIEDFLAELRDTFEELLHKHKNIVNRVLRPDLKKLLEQLVEGYKNNKIKEFIIYSNNASLYPLQYAGREIQKIFNHEIKFRYLDRTNKLRDEYDGMITGARTKTVKTIEKLIKHSIKKEDLLFIDDMIPKHEDFDKFLEDTTNYINITPYYSEITDNELDTIWDIFEKVFTDLLEKHKLEISDVVHIKRYLKANDLDELKNKYLEYSRERTPTVPYNPEDKIDVAIKTQIKPYMLHLSKHRGGRIKKRTRKIKHRYTKRVRNYTEDSDLS